MLIKTLQVTESLFFAVPQIKAVLGGGWPEFHRHLERLHASLRQGPNPGFNDPLIDALSLGFHGAAERIIAGILDEHGFDYRFITGRRRQFKQLRDGAAIPDRIPALWRRVAAKGDAMMASVSDS